MLARPTADMSHARLSTTDHRSSDLHLGWPLLLQDCRVTLQHPINRLDLGGHMRSTRCSSTLAYGKSASRGDATQLLPRWCEELGCHVKTHTVPTTKKKRDNLVIFKACGCGPPLVQPGAHRQVHTHEQLHVEVGRDLRSSNPLAVGILCDELVSRSAAF